VAREKSATPSGLPFDQPLDCGGLFRVVGFDQPFDSPGAGIEFPFVCEFEITVAVEEFDVVEDTDDEEFVR